MAADEALMIVGSLRGVVMMSPFYERPGSPRGREPVARDRRGCDQSESTKRTPDGRVGDDTSRSAVFAADIATDPP